MEQKTSNSGKKEITLFNKEEIVKIIEGYKKLNDDGQMQDSGPGENLPKMPNAVN